MLVLGVVTGLEVCYFALWIGVGEELDRTRLVTHGIADVAAT
jgi:hypothetical protein